MKKILLLLIVLFCIATSCKEDVVKKPKTLVDKDVMIDIIYDLSVLDALRSQTTKAPYSYPRPTDFIKKKYKIDSITFVQNTQYYASDIKEYKKMYDKVKERLEKETPKSTTNQTETPNDGGIVK